MGTGSVSDLFPSEDATQSMDCLHSQDHRLVGDPVDVVTGANTSRTIDFRLAGPITFEWWCVYDSRLRMTDVTSWGGGTATTMTAGCGSTWTAFGTRRGLPGRFHFRRSRKRNLTRSPDGLVLHWVNQSVYRIAELGRPAMEFEFSAVDKTGRPATTAL